MCLYIDKDKTNDFYKNGFNKNNERIVYKVLIGICLPDNKIILKSKYYDYIYTPGKNISDIRDGCYDENKYDDGEDINHGIHVYLKEIDVCKNIYTTFIHYRFIKDKYVQTNPGDCLGYKTDVLVPFIAYKHRLLGVDCHLTEAVFYSLILENNEYVNIIKQLTKRFKKLIKK